MARDSFDEMDFDLANKVSRVALRHAKKGTAIEDAWPDVVKAGRKALGSQVSKAALEVPLTQSLGRVIAEYAALLGRDRPGKKVKGLWFGLVEFSQNEQMTRSAWTPYLAGAKRYSPKDSDWPCGPIWMPDDCYAWNPAMNAMSALRYKHRARHWSIETMLIEPLNTLFTGRAARDIPPEIILAGTASRGIGCGFDDGDFNALGVVTPKGFEPGKGS